MAERLLLQTEQMEEDQTMNIFNSALLDEYKKSFRLWHRVSQDDDYGGYKWKWTAGASFDGILTEDASLTATVAGIETKTKVYGIKVKRDAPLEFKTVFREEKDGVGGDWYIITSDKPLNSPKMSAMDMKILSCQAYEPTDFDEEDEDGDS